VSAFIATAFAQDDAEAATAQWRKVADQLRPKLPKLAGFLDEAETDVLAYMTFPPQHRTKLHSTDKIDKCYFRTSPGTSPDLLESPFLLFDLRCRLSSVPTADFRCRRAQKLSRSAVAPP
jgi:hypothetical protein